MDKLEVILLELRVPVGMSMVRFLCLLEVGEVLVVNPDLKGARCSEQVLVQVLQGPVMNSSPKRPSYHFSAHTFLFRTFPALA